MGGEILRAGEMFAGYAVRRQLGAGGMGAVYLVENTTLRKKFALKVLDGYGSRPELEARFKTEMLTISKLDHPSIVATSNAGSDDGRLWFTMTYVPGRDALEAIQDRPSGLQPQAVIRIVSAISSALDYAHSRNVIHRDVKPSNILLADDGRVYLTDFGIAKILDSGSNLTQTGQPFTADYASPEQIDGSEVDTRTDVYSLGATAYTLLTGQPPFPGSMMAKIQAHLQNRPPRPTEINSALPKSLDRVIAIAMAKDPRNRYGSCSQLSDELRLAFDSGDQIISPPLGDPKAAGDRDADQFTHFDGYSSEETRVGEARVDGPRGPTNPPPPPPPNSGYFDQPEPEPGDDTGGRSRRLIDRTILADGEMVGSCRILRLISRHGTTGDLYKAYHLQRDKYVALKLLNGTSSNALKRNLRSSRLWLNLHHPNLVEVYEVHEAVDGRPAYIISELVSGEDLREFRKLSLSDAVWVAVQVCNGLEHLHARQFVHREVKPSNIMLSSKRLSAKLLDSGIARSANPNVDTYTVTGVFVGDLMYAAPEQLRGEEPGYPADVFGVSAVLYELVTGISLPNRRRPEWVPDPASLERVPLSLRLALMQGLAADADDRFESIAEFRDQIAPFANRARSAGRHAVAALHGIRTHAAWQRTFSEVATGAGLAARVDRWNFGRYSVLKFLSPRARLAKVRWFRNTYYEEFGGSGAGGLPSIVAHSFGTYILGNALIRYPYLRFDKVLLCGSILPRDFPWDQLLDRGQGQRVRNEFGSEDFWTRSVGNFVPGTGRSGDLGFTAEHSRLVQESFAFSHSEYFERGHMERRWVPFLSMRVSERPLLDFRVKYDRMRGRAFGLYLIYLLIFLLLLGIVMIGLR